MSGHNSTGDNHESQKRYEILEAITRIKSQLANDLLDPAEELARLQHLKRGADDYEDLRGLTGSFDFPLFSMDELISAVAAEPPMRWLIRDLVVAGTYGALAAAKKAGKTYFACEMAVCVAAGTPFLGHFEIDTPGPVVLMAGEGRKAMILRRLEAIARHRGVEHASLPIYVIPRVPNLTDAGNVKLIDEVVRHVKPALVILDPLYLAIPGVELSKLTQAAEPLGAIQRTAERHGATLMVVHHWNKGGAGSGFERATGVGLQEWGRFLISLCADRSVDPEHLRGEIADLSVELLGENGAFDFSARRHLWADDPSNLLSTLHYTSEVLDEAEADQAKQAAADRRKAIGEALKGRSRALAGLLALSKWSTAGEIQEHDANHLPLDFEGVPAMTMKTDTLSKALKALADDGLIQRDDPGAGRKILFAPLTTTEAAPSDEAPF